MQRPLTPILAFPWAITHARGAAVLVLGLCATAAARAAPAGEAPSWGLGAAAFSVQQSYTGIKREHHALPLVSYENQYVRVFGPVAEFKAASVDLGGGQRLDLRVIGKYDFSGYETGDAPILTGMRERKSSFWAGARALWRTGVVDVSAEVQADVTRKSRGRRASLGLEKNWRIGEHVMLTPRASAVWLDRKYVDYYYGVGAGEARAGRVAYLGKSGVNVDVGLRGTYSTDEHHAFFLDLGVTRLAKGIKDSPLVDRATENRVGLGYLYRF
jgi:outer membrane protein